MSKRPSTKIQNPAPAPTTLPPPAETEGVEPVSVQSEHLGKVFAQLRLSLVVSTYQAGKLVIVRNDGVFRR